MDDKNYFGSGVSYGDLASEYGRRVNRAGSAADVDGVIAELDFYREAISKDIGVLSHAPTDAEIPNDGERRSIIAKQRSMIAKLEREKALLNRIRLAAADVKRNFR